MAFSISEPVRAKGTIALDIFRNGELVERWNRQNMIVLGASTALCNLIKGDTTGNYAISKIGFGSGTTAASMSDTALKTPFLKAFDSVTISNYATKFAFSLAATEANGDVISEFGLVMGSGNVFSRILRVAPILKQSDLSFSGSWTIQFPSA